MTKEHEETAEERLAEIEFRNKVTEIFEAYWERRGVKKGNVDKTVRRLIWLAEISMRSENAFISFVFFLLGAAFLAIIGAASPLLGMFRGGGQ